MGHPERPEASTRKAAERDLVQRVPRDAKENRAPSAAGLARHMRDPQPPPLARLGGVLDDVALAKALGARHRSRLRLDEARRRNVERSVRLAARRETREPLARTADLFFVAGSRSPLRIERQLLSSAHESTIPKGRRLARPLLSGFRRRCRVGAGPRRRPVIRGGRDRFRTCDHRRVKPVLYR